MLTIVQRSGATREKPPEVVRGYSSRLPWAWDGLCFAVPFNDATRDAARDLVFNVPPTQVSGPLVWAKDNRGNPAARLGSASYIEYPDTVAQGKATTALTAYCRFRRAGTTDPGSMGLFAKEFDVEIFMDTFAIAQLDVGSNILAANITVDGVNYYWETTYVVDTTTWVSAFLRWRSGEAPTLHLLGDHGNLLDSAAYSSTLAGILSYNAGKTVRINAMQDVANNFNADYSQAMLWSRKLSDTELQALVADPYGWYAPRRETIGLSSPYPLLAGQAFMREGSSG